MRLGAPRTLAWGGGVFVAAIVALAAYDVLESYRATVETTGRELETQGRIIAEQTARTIQAVDVVLRHLADESRRGALASMSDRELHNYLREQAIGLVQIDGLVIIKPDGRPRAISLRYPLPNPPPSVADMAIFKTHRDQRNAGLLIGPTLLSEVDQAFVFPVGRRIETPEGRFAGVAGARGKVEYFQRFYRNLQLGPSTTVTLMHQDGTLVARWPEAAAALGRHFPGVEALLNRTGTVRAASPVDGVERFGVAKMVPDYPLAVVVTRDADAAMAPWRAQARGTVLRTLALAALAALLLWMLGRQLARLRASEDRFAVAVAGSDDGIWVHDYVAGTMFNSRRARELAGMPPGPELMTMEDWEAMLPQHLHPDDVARRQEAMDAHLAGRTPVYEVELRYRRPGGGFRWLRIRGECVRGADGRPRRMAGSLSDIDARKRAEDSLRESEDRFAVAVAGSDDGIWLHDYVARRTFNSRRARELIGMPPGPEEIDSDEWHATLPRYLHPDDLPRRDAAMAAHLAGRTPIYEVELRHLQPDGSYRWIRIRGLCVRDAQGKPLRMAGSVSDIDARKRAEDSLRESEERFALAVAGSNDGIVDWDVVNDRMYSSEQAMRICGVQSSVTLRTRGEWRALVKYHPEDQERMQKDLREFLEGRTELRDGEYRVLQPSGDYRWVRHRNKCVRAPDGRPLRVAGSVSDITAYKEAQAARARLEGQLLQAKKLEAIGTLAGGIAHDFNNILAAILGYGEMAQKSAAAGSALRRHVDAVVGAGMRAKSLVERILAFSRSGVGERVAVHVQSVVAEALDLAAASLPAHVRLERRLEAGDAAVLGDPTQIHQVVMNLCANAAQAMKSAGTLTVALDVAQKTRSMAATSALAPGRYVRLSVRDTGSGITPEVLERIFDPFFTTKGVGVGTGLGLSMVHGIVTDLGGGIDVDSRPGEGSVFTVYLPWSGAAAAQAGAEEAPPAGAGETVLLVDDEEVLVRMGEEMLAALGYEPVGFTSPQAALEALRAEPGRFDAVLSDESMPGMTGSELAREIRAIAPALPVVLMSGVVGAALAARAREIGVAEVLAKPLAAGDIARSLAGALRRQAPREAA